MPYEHAIELLEGSGNLRHGHSGKVEPKAGRGVGCVEAPAGP